MKIAVIHNYVDNIGGAERVGLTLARELGGDFYSTNIDSDMISKMGFSNIRLKSIGGVPITAPIKHQLTLFKFRMLDLKDKYDYHIIDGDWAMSAAYNNKPNLWYVHSPIREIWDLYGYWRTQVLSHWKRPFFDLWVKYNRFLNRKYVNHVGKIACNSENTRKRVQKYLGRMDATVIHPPVDTKKFSCGEYGDYWLSVNRLITHKRVDMQLKAFAKIPKEKLIVVGCFEKSPHFRDYTEYCERIKPSNVEILRWVDQKKLIELYANCKGFITTSHNEDFGLTPVEAMASGKAVIAPNEGGYRETVVDGVTGKLVDRINPHKLVDAVKEVGRDPESYKSACLKQAKEFDTKFFIKKIKQELS